MKRSVVDSLLSDVGCQCTDIFSLIKKELKPQPSGQHWLNSNVFFFFFFFFPTVLEGQLKQNHSNKTKNNPSSQIYSIFIS